MLDLTNCMRCMLKIRNLCLNQKQDWPWNKGWRVQFFSPEALDWNCVNRTAY